MEDDVPEDVKRARLERLNEIQRLITAERYEQRLGRTVRVLVDRVETVPAEFGADVRSAAARNNLIVQARTAWQADDIDGVTYVLGADGASPGSFLDVRLDDVVEDVDFTATLVRVVSAPAAPNRPSRALPVMGTGGSIGSFGR